MTSNLSLFSALLLLVSEGQLGKGVGLDLSSSIFESLDQVLCVVDKLRVTHRMICNISVHSPTSTELSSAVFSGRVPHNRNTCSNVPRVQRNICSVIEIQDLSSSPSSLSLSCGPGASNLLLLFCITNRPQLLVVTQCKRYYSKIM